MTSGLIPRMVSESQLHMKDAERVSTLKSMLNSDTERALKVVPPASDWQKATNSKKTTLQLE